MEDVTNLSFEDIKILISPIGTRSRFSQKIKIQHPIESRNELDVEPIPGYQTPDIVSNTLK